MTVLSKNDYKIGILGLGYVGLPLSLLLGRNSGVIGYDSDSEKIEKIVKGQSPISEPELDQLLSAPEIRKNVVFTDDSSRLKETRVKIITVGTPYSSEKDAIDYTQLQSALETLKENLSAGDVVVLKSTVPPGTTNVVVKRKIEEFGFRVPEEIGVAFSPERMVEGQAVRDFLTLPKIIGASDCETMNVVRSVIGSLGGKVIEVSSIETAEMVKMVDNYSRFVFLGLTNEIALISEKYGVDVLELLGAAKDEYPRNAGLLLPGPGVGGSCLNKDPFILRADLKNKGLDLKMVDSARVINESMPKHVVDMVDKFSKGKRRVLLAGIAFKKDTNDVRFSPSIEIYRELKNKGYDVKATDPFVSNQDFPIYDDLYEASRDAGIFVLMCDHSSYKGLNLRELKEKMTTDPLIIDTRGVVDRAVTTRMGFEYHGLGRT
jgi:UDP-N-acetyl-D-mannosaminuronic acid dehydrogenase